MEKKHAILQVVVAVAVLAAAWGIYHLLPKTGEVTLINAANESIIKATLEIDGKKFEFADIPPDGTRKLKFKVHGDTPYSISVEFHYERMLEPEAGYFVSKVGRSYDLIVQHDQVVLETSAD